MDTYRKDRAFQGSNREIHKDKKYWAACSSGTSNCWIFGLVLRFVWKVFVVKQLRWVVVKVMD